MSYVCSLLSSSLANIHFERVREDKTDMGEVFTMGEEFTGVHYSILAALCMPEIVHNFLKSGPQYHSERPTDSSTQQGIV